MKKLCERINDMTVMYYFSGAWIVIIIALFLNTKYFNQPSASLGLNEWGDYLAGFFAPLLFGWLVYGVILQKKEFNNMVTSFKDQHGTNQEQVFQTEVEQLNNWFNRNINMIQTLKNSTFVGDDNQNSIGEIYYKLKEDVTKHSEFFQIFDNLKDILDTILYIEDYLINRYKETGNSLVQKSIKEIQNEFQVLFQRETTYLKAILMSVYFLIPLNKKEGLDNYALYIKWLEDYSDIKNAIASIAKDDENELIVYILNNHEKINLDFKTGKIRT